MTNTAVRRERRTTVVESIDYYLTAEDSRVFTTEPKKSNWGEDKPGSKVRVTRVFVQVIREGDDDPVYTADVYVRNQLASGKFSNGEKLLPSRDYSPELDQFADEFMHLAGEAVNG